MSGWPQDLFPGQVIGRGSQSFGCELCSSWKGTGQRKVVTLEPARDTEKAADFPVSLGIPSARPGCQDDGVAGWLSEGRR